MVVIPLVGVPITCYDGVLHDLLGDRTQKFIRRVLFHFLLSSACFFCVVLPDGCVSDPNKAKNISITYLERCRLPSCSGSGRSSI